MRDAKASVVRRGFAELAPTLIMASFF